VLCTILIIAHQVSDPFERKGATELDIGGLAIYDLRHVYSMLDEGRCVARALVGPVFSLGEILSGMGSPILYIGV
jgi:hypothetical protein